LVLPDNLSKLVNAKWVGGIAAHFNCRVSALAVEKSA
jgi:hypothetical protein